MNILLMIIFLYPTVSVKTEDLVQKMRNELSAFIGGIFLILFLLSNNLAWHQERIAFI